MIETRELTPERWRDLEALFEPVDGCDGCWCMNHSIPPGSPDIRGEAARRALAGRVASGEAHGVLAYVNDAPAGWCATDRRSDVPGHDCALPFEHEDPPSVWSIHCFYVAPAARGRGVARALLRRAVELLRSYGARRIEGYPTLPDGQVPIFDFSGPWILYEELGFRLEEKIGPEYTRMVLEL